MNVAPYSNHKLSLGRFIECIFPIVVLLIFLLIGRVLINIGTTVKAEDLVQVQSYDCSGQPGYQEECKTLVDLYNKTGGSEWTPAVNWFTDTIPICNTSSNRPNWDGITCRNNGIELDLGNRKLKYTIPISLTNLISLTKLSLQGNELSGNIPPELGNLVKLTDLNLSENRLHGEISSTLFSRLQSLKNLYLQNNRLSGAIPEGISALPTLQNCNFNYNMFSSGPLMPNKCNWKNTQTVTPTDLKVTGVTTNSVTLSWTAITYTGNDGYYEISYDTLRDGQYVMTTTTDSKNKGSHTIGSLLSNKIYYFRIRTFTPAHDPQKNDLLSEYSEPISATTLAPFSILFNPDIYNVSETAGSATITVTLSSPAKDPVIVRYETQDGDAKSGEDYLYTTGVLTFTTNETKQSFKVSILNDARSEGTNEINIEYLKLLLSYASNPSQIVDSAELLIKDDDVVTVHDEAGQPLFNVKVLLYNGNDRKEGCTNLAGKVFWLYARKCTSQGSHAVLGQVNGNCRSYENQRRAK